MLNSGNYPSLLAIAVEVPHLAFAVTEHLAQAPIEVAPVLVGQSDGHADQPGFEEVSVAFLGMLQS